MRADAPKHVQTPRALLLRSLRAETEMEADIHQGLLKGFVVVIPEYKIVEQPVDTDDKVVAAVGIG